MKTINKQSENMGGILKLWAVPSSDISVSGNQITFLRETNLIEINLQQDSGYFTEELSESFAGTIYKAEITAILPGDTPEKVQIIGEMERRRKYLVILQDGNGNYKLAGTREVPLRFSARANTGTGAAALNQYSISFTGKQKKRAGFIENPFV